MTIDKWGGRYPGGYRAIIDLIPVRTHIQINLFNPLFLSKEILVRAEDREILSRKNNLYYSAQYHLAQMQRYRKSEHVGKLQYLLTIFHSDYHKITGGAAFPLGWMQRDLNFPSGKGLRDIQNNIADLEKQHEALERELMRQSLGCAVADESLNALARKADDARVALAEGRGVYMDAKRREFPEDQKLDLAIKISKDFINWLVWARGKPGRHPKPFNVLVYHLIVLNTSRKLDAQRRYIYREKGEFKLKTNWPLVMFLLLELHTTIKPIPEMTNFVKMHKNIPVSDALQLLKKKLIAIYSNFPPIRGWPFPRGPVETGFRKLINENGKLRLVLL